MSTAQIDIDKKENVLTITRIFDAPRELVWKAWTDPKHFIQWWGPKNFTTPTCKIDLHVGGKLFYCMRSPEGQDIWGIGVYKEINPPEKIVFSDSFADAEGNIVSAQYYGMSPDVPLEMMITVMFENIGEKTKMILKHACLPKVEIDMAGTGWSESLDKLEEFLK